jgi:hypothetical protein
MVRVTIVLASIVLVMPATLHAQNPRRSWSAAAQREVIPLSGVPAWLKDHEFEHDKFTFVRIKYGTRDAAGAQFRRGRNSWATDAPDADVALCLQIEQLTKLKVARLELELTDATLSDYPFIYLCEPGNLRLTDDEVTALKTYLANDGFLMVDDFWGTQAYDNFSRELQRVLPNHEPVELPLEHSIFHCVFDLKEKPQVPAIAYAMQGRAQGISWEQVAGSDTSTPSYKAIMNDAGRIMVLMCHNTDLADGWERAGVDPWYSEEYSAKKAFPMGINIVFYALTRP